MVPQRAGLLPVAALPPLLLAETKRKELVRARLAPEGPASLLAPEAASAVIPLPIQGLAVLPATSAQAPALAAPEVALVAVLVDLLEVALLVEERAAEAAEAAGATPAAPPAVASLLEVAVEAEEARLAAEDQLQLEVQLVCL